MAPHVYPEPARKLDFSGLMLEGDRLAGSVEATWRTPVYNQHPERPQLTFETEMVARDQTWSCGGQGRINPARRRLPETATTEVTWQYAYEYDPDPKLVSEAAELAMRDGYAAALASARYVREGQHVAPFKGLLAYPGLGSLGGDGKQNYRLMDHAMANLIIYRFSDDPQERAEALRSALHAGEAGEFDTLVSPVGLVGTYKFNSNTHNVAGDAFLNLYEFTGENRWKKATLRFAT